MVEIRLIFIVVKLILSFFCEEKVYKLERLFFYMF